MPNATLSYEEHRYIVRITIDQFNSLNGRYAYNNLTALAKNELTINFTNFRKIHFIESFTKNSIDLPGLIEQMPVDGLNQA